MITYLVVLLSPIYAQMRMTSATNMEWKEVPLSTINMDKGLHKVFKSIVNELSQAKPILGESGSEVSYIITEPRKFSYVTRLS